MRLAFGGEDPPATLPATLPAAAAATGAADAAIAAAATAEVDDTATPRAASSDRRQEAPVPTAATAARDTPWPWYRREPWLGVVLAAFVPIAVGFATPQEFHLLLLGVSAVLVVMGAAMLIRQGPFREHPRPAAARAVDRRLAA